MQNPNDVTTQAFDGIVKEISGELGITDKRFYEILARDNYYAKFWSKMGTPLGMTHPDRLEIIRADFNARCDRLTRDRTVPSTVATLNKECDEAVQDVLEQKPPAETRESLLEARAEIDKQLAQIDERQATRDNAVHATFGRFAS